MTKRKPWPNHPTAVVCNLVIKGEKHRIPENCPPQLIPIIDSCFEFQSKDRPEMNTIFEKLEEIKLD